MAAAGLLSCRRHIRKREDPGDEVGRWQARRPWERGCYFRYQDQRVDYFASNWPPAGIMQNDL